MPPRTFGSLGSSRALARRIAYERELRGWKQTGLANRMTEAGYPMTQSTVSKIENDDPPRRITVDELAGFSQVFRIRADDLMLPPEVAADKTMRRRLERWHAARTKAGQALVQVLEHIDANPSLTAALDELLTTEDREEILSLRPVGRWLTDMDRMIERGRPDLALQMLQDRSSRIESEWARSRAADEGVEK